MSSASTPSRCRLSSIERLTRIFSHSRALYSQRRTPSNRAVPCQASLGNKRVTGAAGPIHACRLRQFPHFQSKDALAFDRSGRGRDEKPPGGRTTSAPRARAQRFGRDAHRHGRHHRNGHLRQSVGRCGARAYDPADLRGVDRRRHRRALRRLRLCRARGAPAASRRPLRVHARRLSSGRSVLVRLDGAARVSKRRYGSGSHHFRVVLQSARAVARPRDHFGRRHSRALQRHQLFRREGRRHHAEPVHGAQDRSNSGADRRGLHRRPSRRAGSAGARRRRWGLGCSLCWAQR